MHMLKYLQSQKELLLSSPDSTAYHIQRYDFWARNTYNLAQALTADHKFDFVNYPFFEDIYIRNNSVQQKYCDRSFNYFRELYRAHFMDKIFGTEFLNEIVQLDVLSISAGSLGTYDVLSKFDNYVISTDFKYPYKYKLFQNYYGVEILHLDGAAPNWSQFKPKQFDYVTIYQAIEAFGQPRRWWRVIIEMQNLARRGVIIIFNTSRTSKGHNLKLMEERTKKQIPKFEILNIPLDYPCAFVRSD